MTFLPTKPSGLLWMACSLSRQLEAKGSAPGPRPAGLSLAGGFSPLPGASFQKVVVVARRSWALQLPRIVDK